MRCSSADVFLRRTLRRRSRELTLQVCKTSVSYETSSKSHASKSPKRVFRTRLPPKVSGKVHRNTHTSSSPAKQFRDSSPSKQHPLTRQSRCHSDIHLHHNSQPHDSLRQPRKFARPHLQHARNVTSATPRNLTIPCNVPQKLHFHASKDRHKVLCLPRKVTISYLHAFSKVYTTPQVWNDFDTF